MKLKSALLTLSVVKIVAMEKSEMEMPLISHTTTTYSQSKAFDHIESFREVLTREASTLAPTLNPYQLNTIIGKQIKEEQERCALFFQTKGLTNATFTIGRITLNSQAKTELFIAQAQKLVDTHKQKIEKLQTTSDVEVAHNKLKSDLFKLYLQHSDETASQDFITNEVNSFIIKSGCTLKANQEYHRWWSLNPQMKKNKTNWFCCCSSPD